MPIRPPRVQIRQVEINGFKSIRKATLDLKPMNVLIGANGAGKSNFVSFFALAAASLDGFLTSYVNLYGGANAFLHQGARGTESIFWQLDVESEEGSGSLAQELSFKAPDSLTYTPLFAKEHANSTDWTTFVNDICAVRAAQGRSHGIKIYNGMKDGITVYHFHDTSIKGPLRGPADISATLRLDGAGSNLPAILFSYEKAENSGKLSSSTKAYSSGTFARISRTVRKFFPGFDKFVLAPEADEQRILLRWRHRDSDHIYGPHQLSDGTLRAIALITLLLQPKEDLPNLMVIDEPELGLHPVGMELIAELMLAASRHCQIIVSTQSTTMLDFFEPEHVVVVEAEKGTSRFRRLDRRQLSRWLKSYSLSDLWRKNVVGGSPVP
jgi:predicted ATPase